MWLVEQSTLWCRRRTAMFLHGAGAATETWATGTERTGALLGRVGRLARAGEE